MTSDIKVDTEGNPKIDLGGYKTYSWVGSAAILHDPDGRWEPPNFDADAEIMFLIDRELRARGKSETRVDPDMLVFYGAGIDMENVDFKIDPETDMEEMTNVPRGALLVVLVDTETEIALWGGVATAEIKQDPDPEVIRKRLEYAVKTMFKRFPN
jgi:hypothetical protein